MLLLKRQVKYVALLCFVFIFVFIINNQITKVTNAQSTCGESSVNVIIRDAEGKFIPNIPFQIYAQVTDVDGLSKPSQIVGSGSIDPNLGNKEVKFTNDNGIYALKVWDKNANVGEFWFYDAANVCGTSITLTKVLSGINVVFRDADGELRKNIAFSVYTQKYDVDGDPIKERSELVASMNTGEVGQSTLYVAPGERSIDGDGSDYYMLETTGVNGGTYKLYDIRVDDASTNYVEYIFSDMELIVRDAQGIPFPANTRIEIYKQEEDVDGNPILGTKIKDIVTDDYGKTILEYPEGLYAARILGANNEYEIFWDLEMDAEERSSYTLVPDSDWEPTTGACEAQSTFTLITRDLSNNPISGLRYELYTQSTDVDGLPQLNALKTSGQVDSSGKGQYTFNPDPRKKYAIKIYDKNAKVGDFIYYNELQFTCGESKTIEKRLPAFKVILRDGGNELRKNYAFSMYTQKFDADDKPIKERQDLVGSMNTGESGVSVMYLAPDNSYDSTKNGTYVFTARGINSAEYNEYDIVIKSNEDYTLEYVFSDVIIELKNGSGNVIKNKAISLHKRTTNLQGEYTLGTILKTVNTDENGEAKFEFPNGNYAVSIKDSLNKENSFWYINIKNRARSRKTISVNTTKIGVRDIKGVLKPQNTQIYVSSLEEVSENTYVVDKFLQSFMIGANGYYEASLRPGPYLISYKEASKEYGKAIYTENGKIQEVVINTNNDGEILAGQKYTLTKPVGSVTMAEKLQGYILLQVEERGEAWYIDPSTKQRYYMKDGEVAYEMLRKFGLGITNDDLKKIPIGIEKRFEEMDYDGDYVFDKMEEAIGTDMYLFDSDGDSFDDGSEILNNYSPTGSGKLPIDTKVAEKLKGKILLQVESRGEAWYVNPKDGRRYYMPDGEAAYEIMRFLSLGITNENLEEIEQGYIKVE